MKEISAGGVVLNRGRVALVTQKNGSYSFPKGHVEPGESLLDCAYREISEEAGIGRDNLTFVRELGAIARPDGGTGRPKEIHLFLFRTDKEALLPLDPDNPEAVWVALDDAPGRLTYEKDKEFILKLKDSLLEGSG